MHTYACTLCVSRLALPAVHDDIGTNSYRDNAASCDWKRLHRGENNKDLSKLSHTCP